METIGQRIYGFWDGDFTFHRVEYDDPLLDHIIRVRIDNESPEERARQNEANYNDAPTGWKGTRPATQPEIDWWLAYFAREFPIRPEPATEGLRHLRINGRTSSAELPVAVSTALLRLTFPVLCVRDFRPTPTTFVEIEDGGFALTDDGMWLTSRMK